MAKLCLSKGLKLKKAVKVPINNESIEKTNRSGLWSGCRPPSARISQTGDDNDF
jgi:hypothetical protein